jgi:hypothetical protein
LETHDKHHAEVVDMTKINPKWITFYATTLSHLTLLKKEGVVTERLSGKTRFFRFSTTVKAQVIVKLLEEWEN